MSDVFRKLNLKDQREILVVNAPGSFEPELLALKDVTVRRSVDDPNAIAFTLAFVITQDEVDRLAKAVAARAHGRDRRGLVRGPVSARRVHQDDDARRGVGGLGRGSGESGGQCGGAQEDPGAEGHGQRRRQKEGARPESCREKSDGEESRQEKGCDEESRWKGIAEQAASVGTVTRRALAPHVGHGSVSR